MDKGMYKVGMIFGAAVILVLGVILGDVVVDTATASLNDPNTCLFNIGVLNLGKMIPFIYYSMLVTVAAGFIAWIGKSAMSDGQMGFTSLNKRVARKFVGYAMPASGVAVFGLMIFAVGMYVVAGNNMPGTEMVSAGSERCLLTDGSNSMTAALNVGGNNITNVTNINQNAGGVISGDRIDAASNIHGANWVATSGDILTANIQAVGGNLSIDGVSSSGIVVNDAQADVNFAVETNTTTHAISVDAGVNGGVGSVTLGYGVNPNVSRRAYFKVYPPAMTTANNTRTFWAHLEGGYAMTMTGTVPIAGTLGLIEPNISGTPTVGTTLYVENAPTEGTNNYAVFVDDGTTRLDGPLQIQNTSQASSPGTTIDGQIRLWEELTTGGRIVAQIDGVTYQWNNDSGIVFENRAAKYNADKTRFRAELIAWQQQTASGLYDEYTTISRANNIPPVELVPTFTYAFMQGLRNAYQTLAGTLELQLGDDDAAVIIEGFPGIPTIDTLRGLSPVPNPANYRVPDSTSNETVDLTTGEAFAEGSVLVLVVDRVTTDPNTGEVMDVHAVPSTLEEELLRLLANDDFKARVVAALE
jgi:hypothetical protein